MAVSTARAVNYEVTIIDRVLDLYREVAAESPDDDTSLDAGISYLEAKKARLLAKLA